MVDPEYLEDLLTRLLGEFDYDIGYPTLTVTTGTGVVTGVVSEELDQILIELLEIREELG